jgi:hypothetical protein
MSASQTDIPPVDPDTTAAPALSHAATSWLNQRVSIHDANAADSVRRGWVIHVGTDRRLLVLWDDNEQTSLVSPHQLVESHLES